MPQSKPTPNNVSFSRPSIRSLLGLSLDDQARIHKWVEQMSVALQKGEMPGSKPGEASDEATDDMQMKLTSYGGPFFGVDIDERVHLVCAFTQKTCAVFALNQDGKFDY